MKINQRLFDYYGINTQKDIGIKKNCPRPFDTVLIDKQGSCYACECQSWLPQSIGNLQIRSLEKIIGSDIHNHIRKAIEDGTYRYCNENQCSYIRDKQVYESYFLHAPPTHVKHLRLAIDDSCNLRCPSCRTGMVFHKEGSAYRLGIRLADKINEWLQQYRHPVQVHIGSDGDPFASHIYRHFMANTPDRSNITYSILTNGLMFKDFHDRVPHVINGLKKLALSIDGASQDTYEKLRLGGKWDRLLENIEHMSAAKERYGFDLHWHMVVQNDNWKEMSPLADMATKHGVDRLFLNKIEDWNTALDHSQQDFMSHNGFKEELARAMKHPIVRSWTLS